METPLFQNFLSQFYQTEVGEVYWQLEQEMVDDALKHVFGYHALQVGLTGKGNLLQNTRVSHQTLVDFQPAQTLPTGLDAQVVADLNYLPFQKDALDLVFLPHTLEAVKDSYHILRQVDELIVPEGSLVISGFNPYGCGIWHQKLKHRTQASVLEGGNLIHPKRIVDWLQLLGYDIERIEISPTSCLLSKHNQTWPVLRGVGRFLSWLGLETGNVYVILAKKRISSPTPVGLNWKFSQLLALKKGRVAAMSRQSHLKEKAEHEAG